MPAVLLGNNAPESQEGQATYESKTEEVEDGHTHTAAFMILVDKEGNYIFESDINKPIVVKRQPTPSEIKGSLAAILGDIRTQETAIMAANATLQGQMQMAKQMQEQAATQQVLQQMGRTPR